MASVLTNASNFTMDNAQFNVAQTNIHQGAIGHNDPMGMLLSHSALSAMADSPTVYEPTCHLGTRTLVSAHIMVWARDPKATPILWLSGPAGAGKSCIQRTIVQSTTAEGLFVACFFFSIKQSETNNQTRFVATLAAQLAENIPGLKSYIERAIKNDGRVFTKALESQVEGLIFQPLQELGSMWNRLKRLLWRTLMALGTCQDPDTTGTRGNVIVIDGLDECVDPEEQARIIRLIHAIATHPHVPFRFAIASRPEYAIRTAFFSSPLSNDTLILRLEEYEADGDLRRFLRAEFSHLKSNHPTYASIPAGWPSPEDETALVTKASRQFVYVSVVMKHLKNPRRNPMLELRRIVDYRPSANVLKSNPFAELDALYDRILHPPDIDTSLLKSILHSIIHDRPRESMSPVNDFDTLFSLRPGTTASILVDLHSLLNFNSPTQRPTFHHKSLEDFLTSHFRARDLYQSNDQIHAQLTRAYYKLALGEQHRAKRPTDGIDAIWDLCLLTTSHACSVSDWAFFPREFVKDILPGFLNRVFRTMAKTQSLSSAEVLELRGMSVHPGLIFDTDSVMCEHHRRLDPYWHRYHFVFCTTKDGCLPRCKLLDPPFIAWARGGERRFAPPVIVDSSSNAGCKCTEPADANEDDGFDNRGNGRLSPIHGRQTLSPDIEPAEPHANEDDGFDNIGSGRLYPWSTDFDFDPYFSADRLRLKYRLW